VIYSRWRPDRGGYDYFESPERFGLGDDLPTPSLPGGTSIGVPSITAGRTPPKAELRAVGSGKQARGMIMPTERTGLEGVGVLAMPNIWVALGVGAGLGAVAYYVTKKRGAA
jgi:hypothetical protein